jgi:hypothetical protein
MSELTCASSRFRPISIEELPVVAEFDRRVDRPRNSTFDPDFYSWQYVHSGGTPRDPSPAIAAWDGATVIGTMMLSDVDVRVEAQVLAGSYLHEWYGAPGCGPVGLELLASVLTRLPVIIGAGPSMSSMVTFQRVRRYFVVPLQRLVGILDPAAAASLSSASSDHTLPYLRSIAFHQAHAGAATAEPIEAFDDDYDAVWAAMCPSLQLTADRTASYMNWRYCQHPRLRYRVLRTSGVRGRAYFVWRVEQVPLKGCAVARVCEAIGTPDAIADGTPALLHTLKMDPALAFADFFCTNDAVCSALIEGGFHPALTLPGLDLPRLFSPLASDVRKTLYFYLSLSRRVPLHPRLEPSRTYLTKGDSNQDRPNP